ncbi:c-type cytochrome [Parahaliea mediterranea]|uniref:Cytochrome c n=1 Tax=Parahaliea mediterranea TaxID=651086 RepID=A0A939IJX4_9GAMM|nr:cytochrome c [Parahaliea mediterranea]MBN7798149.1 cytochrome c [Parahaliea mediterranea]
MRNSLRRTLLAAAGLSGIALAPLALSHFDDKEPMQSYRQSYFALVASNFGPMGAMVKGDMPWDDAKMQAYAENLDTLMELDLLRGFAAGSERGTTRAKPEIWENQEDFADKFEDLRKAVDALDDVVEDGGERAAIARAVGETGKACKACHDDYKTKDYLY